MKHDVKIVLVALALMFAPSASAQTQTLDVEQALTNPEWLLFSQVLRPRAGDVRMASGAVAADGVLLSVPVAHRRTAVVEQDVGEGLGILVSPRVLRDGARGYWSGNFAPSYSTEAEAAWCFIDERETRARSVCFVPRTNGKAPASWSRNLYLAEQLSITTEVDDQWDAPLASERLVPIHDDLRLDYVFGGWRSREVEIEVHVGGALYVSRRYPIAANGTVTLPTAAGSMILRRPDSRARSAIVEWLPNTLRPLDPSRMLTLADTNLRPIPLVRAQSNVVADADFRVLEPGAEVFAQEITPASAMGVDQRPFGIDERSPNATGPFAPYQMNGHDLVCAMSPRVDWEDVQFVRLENGRRVVAHWDFCLEDADGAPGYENLRGFPRYITGSSVGMLSIVGAIPLEQPLAPVELHPEWPVETLRVYYVSGDDERRTSRGLRPTIAVFRLAVGDTTRLQPDWWILPVQLDQEGRGELRLGGRVVARVRDVALDGSAHVQVVEGLPFDAGALLAPSDFVR